MYRFETRSGTTWIVDSGRITRRPSPYTPPEVSFRHCPPIERASFRWVESPQLGKQAIFLLAGVDGNHVTGLITRIDAEIDDPQDPHALEIADAAAGHP